MAKDLFVVVVGCGRLGTHLANELSRMGHSVVAVDSDESAFSDLSPEYSGFRIEGDATEFAVLKQAKIDQADLVITTTRDDNINLMIAQVARAEFGVPRVIARVFDPQREAIYKRMDVETVSPTSVAAELFLDLAEKEGSG